MINTITFESGDKTCAIVPGRFCRFLGVKRFGTQMHCILYDEKLYDSQPDDLGWVLRCKECLQEQGVDNL